MNLLNLFLLVVYIIVVSPIKCRGEELCDGCPGIIVDTDCGGDDAMAISLLLRAEAERNFSHWGKVIGFTTVTGNTGAVNVTRNVKALINILGRSEIPVYRGMEDGLALHIPPSGFFGADGLGDFLPPVKIEPFLPSNVNPGLYLASMVHRYPNQITILCIGPLTNLAMAVHFNSYFFNEVRHILILGGDYRGEGNVEPGIEANMYSDPDAATYFFSKIPSSASNKIYLLPIETIPKFPMSFRIDILGKYNNTLMKFLNQAERKTFAQYGKTWPCYDPTAASLLIDNNIIGDASPAWVEVINQGPRGAMFASFNRHSYNVNIITKVINDRLRNEVLQNYLSH